MRNANPAPESAHPKLSHRPKEILQIMEGIFKIMFWHYHPTDPRSIWNPLGFISPLPRAHLCGLTIDVRLVMEMFVYRLLVQSEGAPPWIRNWLGDDCIRAYLRIATYPSGHLIWDLVMSTFDHFRNHSRLSTQDLKDVIRECINANFLCANYYFRTGGEVIVAPPSPCNSTNLGKYIDEAFAGMKRKRAATCGKFDYFPHPGWGNRCKVTREQAGDVQKRERQMRGTTMPAMSRLVQRDLTGSPTCVKGGSHV